MFSLRNLRLDLTNRNRLSKKRPLEERLATVEIVMVTAQIHLRKTKVVGCLDSLEILGCEAN